jgi:cell division protein FtsQ
MFLHKFSLQTLFWIGVFLAVLLIGFGVIYSVRQSSFYSIEVVEVHGDLQQFNPHELEAVIKPFTTTNFFQVNIENLQAALQKIPGLGTAKVRRVWPNRLRIDLYNQDIVALWNQSNLLNIYGEIFPIPQGISVSVWPQFFGPTDKTIVMIDLYRRMNQLLRPLKLTIDKMYLKDDKSWIIILSSGTELQLGQKHILTRLKQFVKVYNKVFVRPKELASQVDLRYSQGMAIKWVRNSK